LFKTAAAATIMENFVTLIPSTNSHITHTMGSTINEQGIQAHIFINRPVEEEYADIQPLSVYLVTVDKAEHFLPFPSVKDKALVIPLAVYINLLEFFHLRWHSIKTEVEKKFKLIRRKKNPYQIDTCIHFYLSGTVYFERWFNDVFLCFKKCSTDFTPLFISLQRASNIMNVDPEVLAALAASYENLLNILYQAGYNHQSDYEPI